MPVGVSVVVRQVGPSTVPGNGTVTGASVATVWRCLTVTSVVLDVASGRVNLPDWKGKTRSDAKKLGICRVV